MIHNIKITKSEVLSDNWYILRKITYTYTKDDGSVHTQHREAYDRGNGAAILLYNSEFKTVILTSQFRLPSYVNGNESGMLIEACAGLLDENNPEDCIRKETEEETGYKIKDVKRILEVYMSPGAVTEKLYFFIAEYTPSQRISEGGGAHDEEENIDVLELNIDDALRMIETGEIRDAKTIILLQWVRLHGII
jgi:GDP-mannose pyrophosphatase NudK